MLVTHADKRENVSCTNTQTQIKLCATEKGEAEELWCVEAVHLLPSLGPWDTASSSVTFSNPNHVLCMASVTP